MSGRSFHGDSSVRLFGIAIEEVPQGALGDEELLPVADASDPSVLQRCIDRVAAESQKLLDFLWRQDVGELVVANHCSFPGDRMLAWASDGRCGTIETRQRLLQRSRGHCVARFALATLSVHRALLKQKRPGAQFPERYTRIIMRMKVKRIPSPQLYSN
jgi:hypothetical protein